MQDQLKDKVVALTGGASGIGFVTAQVLAARGAKLALCDVNMEGLQAAQKSVQEKTPNAEVMVTVVDVRVYEQVESWIKETVSKFGRLDGAVNLAGVVPRTIGSDAGRFDQMDPKDWEFAMSINATGVMHCMKAQLLAMSEGGSLVNASSIAGLVGRPRNGAYAASKHAVMGMTRSAAKEVGEKQIRINAVCPGRIDTPMSRAASASAVASGSGADWERETVQDIALKRKGAPEEVATLIAFLLSSDSSYITGNAISVDGGWNC